MLLFCHWTTGCCSSSLRALLFRLHNPGYFWNKGKLWIQSCCACCSPRRAFIFVLFVAVRNATSINWMRLRPLRWWWLVRRAWSITISCRPSGGWSWRLTSCISRRSSEGSATCMMARLKELLLILIYTIEVLQFLYLELLASSHRKPVLLVSKHPLIWAITWSLRTVPTATPTPGEALWRRLWLNSQVCQQSKLFLYNASLTLFLDFLCGSLFFSFDDTIVTHFILWKSIHLSIVGIWCRTGKGSDWLKAVCFKVKVWLIYLQNNR